MKIATIFDQPPRPASTAWTPRCAGIGILVLTMLGSWEPLAGVLTGSAGGVAMARANLVKADPIKGSFNAVKVDKDVVTDDKEREKAMLDYSAETLTLGSGYNTFTKEVLSDKCVKGTFLPPPKFVPTVDTTLRFLDSIDELTRDMSVEASLNAGSGKFSASLTSKYKESEKNSVHKTFLLFKQTVTLSPSLEIRNEEFGEEIAKSPPPLGKPKNQDEKDALEDFADECGDAFVTAVTRGGQFVALITFEQNRQDLSNSFALNAGATYGLSSASVDLTKASTELKQKTGLEVHMFQMGGTLTMDDAKPVEGAAGVDLLMKLSVTFPQSVMAGSSVPVGISWKSYGDIERKYRRLENYAKHYFLNENGSEQDGTQRCCGAPAKRA